MISCQLSEKGIGVKSLVDGTTLYAALLVAVIPIRGFRYCDRRLSLTGG